VPHSVLEVQRYLYSVNIVDETAGGKWNKCSLAWKNIQSRVQPEKVCVMQNEHAVVICENHIQP
jgi:hypothetical protein